MANNTQIMSVSCPKVLVEFLEEAELSPSELFQDAIIEKKQLWDNLNKEKLKLIGNIERLQALVQSYISFLELKNLNNEYLSWKNSEK